MRRRAWMFCSAKFSVCDPPCTLYSGFLPVTSVKSVWMASTQASMLRPTW